MIYLLKVMEQHYKNYFYEKRFDFIEDTIHQKFIDKEVDVKTRGFAFPEIYKNITMKTVLKRINRYNWNWDYITVYLPYEDIINYPEYKWNFICLSKNKNIPLNFIEENINKNWNFDYLSDNPNITGEFVSKNLDKKWNWNRLSVNSGISLNMIDDYQDLPWVWSLIAENSNITEEFVKKHNDKKFNFLKIFRWCSFSFFLSQMQYFNNLDELIFLHKYSYEFLSYNPNIMEAIEFLNSNIEIAIELNCVIHDNTIFMSKNNHINSEFILNNLHCKWDFRTLSSNKCINANLVKSTIRRFWCWTTLSINPSITLDLVIDTIKKPWHWESLSRNPTFTFNTIKNNLHLPWMKRYIVKNPNICHNIILNNQKAILWKKKEFLSNYSELALKKFVKFHINLFLEMLFNRNYLCRDVRFIIYEYLGYFEVKYVENF